MGKYSKEYRCIGGSSDGDWLKIERAVKSGYCPYNLADRPVRLNDANKSPGREIESCVLIYVETP